MKKPTTVGVYGVIYNIFYYINVNIVSQIKCRKYNLLIF